MDRTPKLSLNNLVPLWEREVPNLVHKSIVESFLLAQDVFSAFVLRRRSFKDRI